MILYMSTKRSAKRIHATKPIKYDSHRRVSVCGMVNPNANGLFEGEPELINCPDCIRKNKGRVEW